MGTKTIIPEATIGNNDLSVIGVPVAIYLEINHPQKNNHNKAMHTIRNITAPLIIPAKIDNSPDITKQLSLLRSPGRFYGGSKTVGL